MPGRRATLPALAAACAAALAGCGGEGPVTPSRGGTARVALDEYKLTPQRISVDAGRIRLVGRNVGRLTHNLTVVQFERPLGDEQERELGRTRTAHPGDVVQATVRLRPGRYRLVCTIANHDNLGQYGELVVARR